MSNKKIVSLLTVAALIIAGQSLAWRESADQNRLPLP
jgi:hypothetical protein